VEQRAGTDHRERLAARAAGRSRPAIPIPCGVSELRDLAERHAPFALFPAAARARLRQIVDPLPPVACAGALECRLAAGDARVDFEVCLRGTPETRRRLAEAAQSPRAEVLEAPGWRRALAVLRAWSDPVHPVHTRVAAVWLEFDAPPDTDSPPVPFAVLTLDPGAGLAEGRVDPAWLRESVRVGLAVLAGATPPPLTASAERLLAALPPSAQLLHLALRPAEAGCPDALRVVLRLPWRILPRLLERLDWPGSVSQLSVLLGRLCRRTLVHSVNLDFGERIGPRVGIEFHHPTSVATDPRWRELLDALEALGACSPAMRRELAGWTSPPENAAAGALQVHRELLVKVVHEPGAPLEAKAYLAFAPRRVPA